MACHLVLLLLNQPAETIHMSCKKFSVSLVHLALAVVVLNRGVWIRVVKQLHQQRDELSVLNGVGDHVVGIAEVAVQHGLNGGAQLPQLLPRLGGHLAARQRISIQRHFHSVTANCSVTVNTKSMQWECAKMVIKLVIFFFQAKLVCSVYLNNCWGWELTP